MSIRSQKCRVLGLWRRFQAAPGACAVSPSPNTAVSFNWLCVYDCSNIHGGKSHLRCVIVSRLQKLALRNNSTSSAQHLRLLIRGQDQDCFQVCGVHGSVLFRVRLNPGHLTRVGHLVFLVFEEFMLMVCFICAAALFYAEIFF